MDQLTLGWGGWVWHRSDTHQIYVRFEERAGRFVPIDLFMWDERGLTGALLRELPIHRVEAWVNDPHIADELRLRSRRPGPDLRTAAQAFGTHVTGDLLVNPHYKDAPKTWVQRMLLSKIEGSGEPLAMVDEPEPARATAAAEIDTRLTVPSGRPYGNDFYGDVAGIYNQLAQNGVNPAPAMATTNNVPVTTVHRWIREARRRGLLAPGVQGRAG